MRILWASNAPWGPTGYGVQTALTVERLVKAGHEVAIGANFGLQGATIEWEHGVPVLPNAADSYGNDILKAQYMDWTKGGLGWLITLYDVWVYKPDRFEDVHLASWTPIDHFPAPPGVLAWAREHETIAMSRFGERMLRDKGIDATYIPHVIDTRIFTPGDKSTSRKVFGIPDDAYVVMMNAANKGAYPPRKAWSENFGALAMFMGAHPDVHAFIHTDIFGIGGVDLGNLAQLWAIPGDRLHFVSQYEYKLGRITQAQLAAMYRAADVLLATSMGEGFGVPTIEAQACGTPVIVSNFSAQPELVGAGWLAEVQPYHDHLQGAFFGMPIIGSIVEKLEAAYEVRGSPELAAAAVTKAAEYEVDKVFAECWVPYLDRLADRLKPQTLPRRARRAEARKKKRAA